MAQFSKKTYDLVARHIATVAAEADGFAGDRHKFAVLAALEGLVIDFAATFDPDNPAFNRERFVKACSIPEFKEEELNEQ